MAGGALALSPWRDPKTRHKKTTVLETLPSPDDGEGKPKRVSMDAFIELVEKGRIPCEVRGA